jgi:hypothetical protein
LLPFRPLPPPLPPEAVTDALRERASAFTTLKDTGITLILSTTVDGRRRTLPRLGGHIILDRSVPAMWLHAEKLGRTRFSLKAAGDRFQLDLHETTEVVVGGPAAYEKLPHLIRPDEADRLFSGPDDLGLTWPTATMSVEGRNYRFDVTLSGRPYLEALVDRRRVALVRVRRYDALGRVVTEVQMGNYKKTDALDLPRRLVVLRPMQGVGVELRLGRPSVNEPIPPEAFVPAEHPGWRRIDLDVQPLSDVEAFREE